MSRWLTALGLLSCLLPAAPALAAPLELLVVEARKGGGHAPAETQVVARELRSQGYTGFAVEQRRRIVLTPGRQTAMTLPDDRRLRVRLIEESAASVRIEVWLVRGGAVQLDSIASLPDGKPLLLRVGRSDGADRFVAVVTR